MKYEFIGGTRDRTVRRLLSHQPKWKRTVWFDGGRMRLASSSLHWTKWAQLCRRLHRVSRSWREQPWWRHVA